MKGQRDLLGSGGLSGSQAGNCGASRLSPSSPAPAPAPLRVAAGTLPKMRIRACPSCALGNKQNTGGDPAPRHGPLLGPAQRRGRALATHGHRRAFTHVTVVGSALRTHAVRSSYAETETLQNQTVSHSNTRLERGQDRPSPLSSAPSLCGRQCPCSELRRPGLSRHASLGLLDHSEGPTPISRGRPPEIIPLQHRKYANPA